MVKHLSSNLKWHKNHLEIKIVARELSYLIFIRIGKALRWENHTPYHIYQ